MLIDKNIKTEMLPFMLMFVIEKRCELSDKPICVYIYIYIYIYISYLSIYHFVVVEAEHGYASTMPIPDDMRTVTKRPKTKKSQGSRFVSKENFLHE